MLGALIALLCVNEYQLSYDVVVQDLAQVEKLIDSGSYELARKELDSQPSWIADEGLRQRLRDLGGLLAMRAKQPKQSVGWVLPHFASRHRTNKKDPRFTAWLAEAYLADGHPTQALALVTDLANKDLMPDAFAYVVLAKLSTGEARESALAACRTRAKAKSICVVPKG